MGHTPVGRGAAVSAGSRQHRWPARPGGSRPRPASRRPSSPDVAQFVASIAQARRGAWGIVDKASAVENAGDVRELAVSWPRRAPFVLAADDGAPCEQATDVLKDEQVPELLDALINGEISRVESLLERVVARAAARTSDGGPYAVLRVIVAFAAVCLLVKAICEGWIEIRPNRDDVRATEDGLGAPPPPDVRCDGWDEDQNVDMSEGAGPPLRRAENRPFDEIRGRDRDIERRGGGRRRGSISGDRRA